MGQKVMRLLGASGEQQVDVLVVVLSRVAGQNDAAGRASKTRALTRRHLKITGSATALSPASQVPLGRPRQLAAGSGRRRGRTDVCSVEPNQWAVRTVGSGAPQSLHLQA